MRPQAKTYKCPVIALKQVALGAAGVCVQKISEAEAMVQGGVRDVLVTNESGGMPCHLVRHHIVAGPRPAQNYRFTWCRTPTGEWKIKS
jgi:D-serine deaminase-like pyridoxal phosphate-dependent protein